MTRLPKLLLAALLATAATPTPALTPQRVASGSAHQPLFAVAFDGAQGLAVGADGRVLESRDAGKTWQPGKSAGDASLLAVALRGGHRVAVGQAGLVMVANDDGDWRRVAVETRERLLGLDMNARGLAVAVGSFGTILLSSDFGENWRKVGPEWAPIYAADVETLGPAFAPHLYGVSVADDGQIRVVGELSTILASDALSAATPAGWRVVQHGRVVEGQAEASLFAIHLRADGVGYAVGQLGRVLRTADGGASWTALDVGTKSILLAVETLGPKRVVIAGIRTLLVSADDGASWQPLASPDIANDWYAGAARPGGDEAIYLVGTAGRILRLAD